MLSEIGFFSALAVSAPQLFNPPPVNPMTFVSGSGEYDLHVDPGDRSGKGPAQYVMRRGTEIAWEKELPFTLVNLVISEEGRVAGFARDESAIQTFALGPTGEIVGSDSLKKTGISGPHWVKTQRARATLLDEDQGQFTIVVIDQVPHPRTEYRRVFDLRDCTLVQEYQPTTKLPEHDRHGQGVETDPATNAGATIASSNLPVVELEELTPVELQYVPMRLGESAEQSDTDGAKATRGTRSKEQRTDGSLSFRPGSVGVGPRGHVYIQDLQTASVYAFDREGVHRRTAGADSEDASFTTPIGNLAIAPGGDIYVERRRHAYRIDCLHFDRNGKRVGIVDPGAFPLSFVPGKNQFWGWDDHDLILMKTSGEELRRLERRPEDRHWLVRSGKPAVAPDGRLVILNEGLAYFGPDGEPLATIPLPADAGPRVAFSGRWAVVFEHVARALMVDFVDESIFRFEPPNTPDGSSWFWAVSPKADELWMVERYNTSWRRFRLPN